MIALYTISKNTFINEFIIGCFEIIINSFLLNKYANIKRLIFDKSGNFFKIVLKAFKTQNINYIVDFMVLNKCITFINTKLIVFVRIIISIKMNCIESNF